MIFSLKYLPIDMLAFLGLDFCHLHGFMPVYQTIYLYALSFILLNPSRDWGLVYRSRDITGAIRSSNVELKMP